MLSIHMNIRVFEWFQQNTILQWNLIATYVLVVPRYATMGVLNKYF